MTSPTTTRRYGLNASAAIKVPVKAATTANLSLNGEKVVDGISCVTGDRALVKNQTSSVDNGIYVVDTGAWTRDIDFNGVYDSLNGTLVYVTGGAVNGSTYWSVSGTNPIVIGTSSIAFVNTFVGSSTVISYTATGASSVQRTVASKLGDIRSVMDDGAIGDGSTDDTAAFQLAATRNVPVYVPANLMYKITTSVSGPFFSTGYPVVTGGGALPDMSFLRRHTTPPVQVLIGTGKILAFGDSFTTGVQATVTGRAYINRLGQALNMTVMNYGLGGRASYVATTQAFSNNPVINRTDGLSTWMASFNDVYRGAAATKTVSKVKGELRSFLANAFLQTAVAGNSGTNTFVGTWTNMVAMQSKSDLALSAFGKKSSTTGDTMTFSFTGDNVVIGTYNSDASAQHTGGFSLKIDGNSVPLDSAGNTSWSGEGKADGIADGSYANTLTHEAIVVTGLGSGAHTAVLTIASPSSYPVYIDYRGTLMPAPYGAPVVVAEGAFQNTAGWAQGGGVWSQAAMETVNRALNEVVMEFAGYPISVARTNDYLNCSIGIGADNNHPNDLGYNQIFAAFMSAIAAKQPRDGSLTALVSQGTPQSLTNGAAIVIAWDTQLTTPDAAMNELVTHPSRITIPASGYYRFSGNIGFAANVAGIRQVSIAKNGSTLKQLASLLPATGGNETVIPFNCILNAAQGDWFEIQAVQNSGGALNTYTTNYSTFCECVWVR